MGKGKLQTSQVGSESQARQGIGSQAPWLQPSSGDIHCFRPDNWPASPAKVACPVQCHCPEGAFLPRFLIPQEGLWFWVDPVATKPSAPKNSD